nr:diacylglycerol cyltransferase [Dunaliella salina]
MGQPSPAQRSSNGDSYKQGGGRPRRKQVQKVEDRDGTSYSSQSEGLKEGVEQEELGEQERQKASARRHEPMSGSSPVHVVARPSYLSSERMWYEKHTGLVNLMAVIVVATNFRLALENAFKYGLRIQTPLRALNSLTIGNPNIPLALCYPCMLLIALSALFFEQCGAWSLKSDAQLKAAISKKIDGSRASYQQLTHKLSSRVSRFEWVLFVANLVNTSAAVVVPWAVIHYTQAEPLPGGVLIAVSIVLWMKLVSYHHCCADLRAARRNGQVRPGEEGFSGDSSLTNQKSSQRLLRYPENVTVSNLIYFLALPTLCYQINYPRSPTIRKRWLARRVAELVLMLTLLSLLLQQYMIPAISNSMSPMRTMDWPRLCERVLKLALPNIYCWLVSFYCLFHLWLNIVAEVLHFGDREFYKDWWNAATVGEYWKLWNMPVHKWLLRHVYFPTLRLGLPRWASIILVFFVSAVFHELVLGVPLHLVRMWAFLGIMLQVPLVLITEHIHKRLKRDEAGNIVFWLTFCVVGQPLSVLLYYHDYLYEVHPYLKGSSS